MILLLILRRHRRDEDLTTGRAVMFRVPEVLDVRRRFLAASAKRISGCA
jgi:hypothetical protein